MKSDRSAAFLLMSAAVIGLVLANSPVAANFEALKAAQFDFGLFQIDFEHFVSEILLAVFFLVAGLELKYELRIGALSNWRTALVPIVAAIAGVVIPAALYLLVNPLAPASFGWSIPTATDIAFVLGLLAVLGRGLPPAARIFLLALAIFDDVIAILIIAFQFTDELQLGWLALSLIVAFVLRVSYVKVPMRLRPLVLGVAFCIAWYGMHSSGIHATLAGVIVGLAIPAKQTHKVLNRLQPVSNLIILPVFALFAVSIQMPTSFNGGGAVFLGIAVALPLGKLFGISVVGYFANRFAPPESRLGLTYLDFSIVGALAGVGFTVSLLLSKLAFENNPQLQAEAIFGVLIGSSLAIVLTVMLTQLRRWPKKAKRALEGN